MSTDDITWLK